MKRFLVVILALLMCLSVVACDSKKKKNSNDDDDGEKTSGSSVSMPGELKSVVDTAVGVVFGDGSQDVEKFFDVFCPTSFELLDLLSDEKEAETCKRSIEDNRKELTDECNMMKDPTEIVGSGAEDVKFEYRILSCDIYDSKTKTLNNEINGFTYRDTEIEDYVEEIAKVYIWYSFTGKRDGEFFRQNRTEEMFIFIKIDGKWYADYH